MNNKEPSFGMEGDSGGYYPDVRGGALEHAVGLCAEIVFRENDIQGVVSGVEGGTW